MTTVELVNLSLAKLGTSLIIRLGDAAIPGSHFGELLYQPTLERVLRDFPWSFATKEEQLAQLPTSSSERYAYSYTLPADFVRLGELPKEGKYLRNEDFSRMGNVLNTNETPALLSYVGNKVTPDDMDPDFREAFVVLLASELATPLLQSVPHAEKFMTDYLGTALPKAKTSDARETGSSENYGPSRAIATSPLVQSRRHGSRSDYYDHI